LLPAVGGPWSGSHVDLVVSQTRWTVCVCPCAPIDDPTAVTVFFLRMDWFQSEVLSPTALQQMDTLFLNCHPRLQKWLQLLVGYEEIKACTVSN